MENQEENKPSNPSAFPDPMRGAEESITNQNTWQLSEGMDLRDYFAAKAMQGILVTFNDQTSFDTFKHSSEDLASTSYTIADAMLKQREL